MSTGKSKKTISSSDHKVEEPIQIIGKRLEERVDFFMSNIDAIVRKYRNYQASATLPTDLGCISVTPEEPLTPAAATASEAVVAADVASPAPAAGQKRARSEDATTAGGDNTVVPPTTTTTTTDKKKLSNTYYVTVTFPDNRRVIKQLQLLKTEAYELVSLFDSVHDWISISIPELNSEDIPGAPVMLAVVEQVSSLSQTLASVRSMEQKYYTERAQLEKAVLKVPESRMLQLELLTSEEGWWIEAERAWRVLIRCSLLAYTMLARNMDRLKEPAGKSSSAALYYQ